MGVGRRIGKGKELPVDTFERLLIDNAFDLKRKSQRTSFEASRTELASTGRAFLFEALIDELDFFFTEFRPTG